MQALRARPGIVLAFALGLLGLAPLAAQANDLMTPDRPVAMPIVHLADVPRPIPAIFPMPRPQIIPVTLAPSRSLVPAPRPAFRPQPVTAAAPASTAAPFVVAAAAPAAAGLPRVVGHGGARRIWCVTYVNTVTSFNIQGDAHQWWSLAANRYARGPEPAAGAVLAFRSTRGMPLGHVALVAKVVSPREVLVNQANWVRNTVTADTRVVDVSPKNDWSQVRVENLDGTFGGVYPTYGFIYDQSARGQG